MKLIYLLKTIYRILYYLQSDKKRYLNLLVQILKTKPKKILEIGVYNGKRAIQMIEAAKIFNKDIEYFGFDLFEEMNKEIYNAEVSKFPKSFDKIKNLLDRHAKIFLYKGFTEDTLKKFSLEGIKVDFIFIDGGHSVETIDNDFFYSLKVAAKNASIVLDDYYKTNSIDLEKFGSNKIYEKIKLENSQLKLLPFTDTFHDKNGGFKSIKMFMVKN